MTRRTGRCVRGSGRHGNAKGDFSIKLLNQRTGRKTHGEQPTGFFPPLSSIQLFPVLSNKSHMTGKCCAPSGCDDLIRANIPTEFQQINSPVSRDSERKAQCCSDKPPFRGYSEVTFGLSEFIRARLLTDSVSGSNLWPNIFTLTWKPSGKHGQFHTSLASSHRRYNLQQRPERTLNV